jgi:sugar lactone lactonase YvrE
MKKLYFFIVTLLFGLHFSAQNIYTYVGNGSSGFSGDGSLSGFAGIASPDGNGVVDGTGNFIFCDVNNQRIRKVNTSGIITTIAGIGTPTFTGDGGPATSAGLNYPHGIAVDAAGNIYIADSFNHRIRKISPTGTITTIVGTGVAGFSGDGSNALTAQLNNPMGLTIDGLGNLFVFDANNFRIRKITSTGTITTVAGNGTPGYSGDGSLAINAQFNSAGLALAVDGIGNLYIPDTYNYRIRIVTSGTINTICGIGSSGFSGDGGLALSATISRPDGISIDGSNNIYFTDRDNNRVRMITSTGTINTIAGNGIPSFSGDGGLATNAMLNKPDQISVDNFGNLYIGDYFNNRIRVICSTNCPTITNIEESKKELSLSVYPNPSNGDFIVNAADLSNGKLILNVSDILGRSIITKEINSKSSILTLQIQAKGIYFLSIQSGSNQVTKKLIVE